MHDFDGSFERDQASFKSKIQQFLSGTRHDLSAIDGVMVDVHTDKLIGQGGIEIASELQGVIQRFFAMVERILDTFTHEPGTLSLNIGREIAAQRVAAERQWQIVCCAKPFAKIEHVVEAAMAVS